MLETDTEFWISVCCEFSVKEQLQTLMKILQYLTKLPEDKGGKQIFICLSYDLVSAV